MGAPRGGWHLEFKTKLCVQIYFQFKRVESLWLESRHLRMTLHMFIETSLETTTPRRVHSEGWLKFPIIQTLHFENGKEGNNLRQNGNSVPIPLDSPGYAKHRWQGGELGKEQGFLSVIKRSPEKSWIERNSQRRAQRIWSILCQYLSVQVVTWSWVVSLPSAPQWNRVTDSYWSKLTRQVSISIFLYFFKVGNSSNFQWS